MGRPEKLSKEKQAEAVAKIGTKPNHEICAEYGISSFTLYRYERVAKSNAEAISARTIEEMRTAQEIAAESTPEAA